MQIEQHGVGTIPDHERTSRPRDVVSFLLSAAVSAAVFQLVARRADTPDATPAPAAQETPVAV